MNEPKTLTDHIVEGVEKHLTITAVDPVADDGAHHLYEAKFEGNGNMSLNRVRFQKGAIKIVGVNGLTHEALLAIIIDRLTAYQSGDYACDDNAHALYHIKEALGWLKSRTKDRLARGVEGTPAL